MPLIPSIGRVGEGLAANNICLKLIINFNSHASHYVNDGCPDSKQIHDTHFLNGLAQF